MDGCQSCHGHCCHSGNIMVFHDEFDRLLQFHIPIPHRDTDLIKSIYEPCPFFIQNRCSIYNDRTITCRRYPLYIKKGAQSNSVEFAIQCPPFSPNSQLNHLEYNISKVELTTMIEAAIESEARMILAEFFLSSMNSVPSLPIIHSAKKKDWIQELVEYRSCSKQIFQELVAIYIVDLLRRPSYRAFLERDYKDKLQIYDKIIERWK